MSRRLSRLTVAESSTLGHISRQLMWRQASVVGVLLTAGLALVLSPAVAASVTLKPVPFLIILSILAGTLVREHALGRLRLLSPVTITFAVYAVMFAIVPLADISYGNASTYDRGYSHGSWLGVAGAATLALGFMLGGKVRPWGPRPPIRHEPVDRTGAPPTGAATFFAVAIMAFVYVFVLKSIGGPQGITRLASDFAGRRTFLGLTPLIGRVVSLVPAALALRAMDVVRRPSRRAVIGLLVVWMPLAVFATGFYGERFRALSVLVMMIGFVHYGLRRLPFIAIAAMVGVLFALFVYAGVERNVVGTSQQGISLTGSGFYTNYVGATHEFGQFRDFVLTVEGVPSRIPFQHGRTFLTIIPGVPFSTAGSLISRAFYPDLFAGGTSIPTPLPGELYLNFAVPGLLIGMMLFGLAIAVVESWCARNWYTLEGLAVFALSLLHLPLILRGDATTFGGTYLIALIALLVCVHLARRVSGASGPSSPQPLPWPG